MLDRQILEAIEDLVVITRYKPCFFEKDWYTTQVLKSLSEVDDSRFGLVFSGGTSLSKGYGLIDRFSEDIDFKVKEFQDGMSRTDRRQLRLKMAEVIESIPGLELRNKDRFTRKDGTDFFMAEIGYQPYFPLDGSLRDCIQVELNFKQPVLAVQMRSLPSLVNRYANEAPEIPSFACVNLSETAADKLGALSWRVLSTEPDDRACYDPRTIRHLYDLAYLTPQVIDDPQWASLSYRTIDSDRARDKTGKLNDKSPRQLLTGLIEKLSGNRLYAEHYEDFVQSVAYGTSKSFVDALDSLSGLSAKVIEQEADRGNLTIRSDSRAVDLDADLELEA